MACSGLGEGRPKSAGFAQQKRHITMAPEQGVYLQIRLALRSQILRLTHAGEESHPGTGLR